MVDWLTARWHFRKRNDPFTVFVLNWCRCSYSGVRHRYDRAGLRGGGVDYYVCVYLQVKLVSHVVPSLELGRPMATRSMFIDHFLICKVLQVGGRNRFDDLEDSLERDRADQ